ncbi:hypothetical protein F511_45916 [Dorcoceras hygrometricum]|uniref:Uncharacterized protein n=1 Tax=Dorcoceras hygrometricum TaxID=472368 RepID=A0A2Z7A2D9_9LAMI|nr:hypothetical protein F511_45916 [Dorcoceras hygrometricum]
MDMLAVITRMLERQSERSGKSHEEDVAELFRKQGPRSFRALQIHLLLRSGSVLWRPFSPIWVSRTLTGFDVLSS